jgi:cyclopropane-fatty-acyl-phospholipid synthase
MSQNPSNSSGEQEPLMRTLTEPMDRRQGPQGTGRVTLGLRFMLYMLRGMRVGSLDVTLPDGSLHQLRGEQEGPHGVLNVRDGALIGHVLRNGEVGFGEAYLEGCWDTPDLTRLLTVLYLNEPHYRGPYEKNPLGRFWGWIQHKRRANTKSGSRENIEYHYDLGNHFYKLWLDDTMAYSSAVFHSESETLTEAQENKFRILFERLELRPEHHLLEIGSGWGGFAIYCAKHSGCRVTSITLSSEQLAEARVRAEAEGVAERVVFELRDYRDVQGEYDRVASIEMYEAVGEDYWADYFRTIERALKPGGKAAIQGITIDEKIFDEYRRKRDFIQKYIFPGGMLCPPERFQAETRKAGLIPEDPRFFADDYARTLAVWHRNVLAHRNEVVEQFDERFLRMWRYYLSYCECGFNVRSIDLMQITLRKSA